MGDDTSSEDSSSVQDVGDEANSEGEVSSSELEVEEPVLVAEKKVAARKPSKKALENAMNEVSAILQYMLKLTRSPDCEQ